LGKGILRGKGNKLIRFQFIKEWTFLYPNLTVDVITLNEYTSQVSKFYLQNSRLHQKTNFDCQIDKMQGGQEMGENSFASNSTTD
jgi:hypothetical protein